jgi:hypothetical protein
VTRGDSVILLPSSFATAFSTLKMDRHWKDEFARVDRCLRSCAMACSESASGAASWSYDSRRRREDSQVPNDPLQELAAQRKWPETCCRPAWLVAAAGPGPES